MAHGKVIAKRVTLVIPIEKWEETQPLLESIGSVEQIGIEDLHEQVPYWSVEMWDKICAKYNVNPEDIHTIKVGDVWWQCRFNGIDFRAKAYDKNGNVLIGDADEFYNWGEEFRDTIRDYNLSGKQVLESIDPVISRYGYKLVSLDDDEEITEKYWFEVEQGMDS